MTETTTPVLHALAGFGAGISLIAAIGAQNAFVLRQGILRRHVLPVVLVCALSDAILITVGVAGLGVVIERFPVAITVATWAGIVFLLAYGALAARRAIRPSSAGLDAGRPDPAASKLWPAVLACLAFTWLNPHVYLDTVLLLGSVASAHGDPGRWYFAAGAVAASFLWFSALGWGARLLEPVFAKPAAWRVLDGIIALVMAGIALQLFLSLLG